MRALSFTFFVLAMLIVGMTVFALVARTRPILGSATTAESPRTPGPVGG